MSVTLSKVSTNGSLNYYGSIQGDVLSMPYESDGKVRVVVADDADDGSSGGGVWTTRDERLRNLPDLPFDDRAGEVTAALVATGIVSSCLLFSATSSLFGMDDLNGYVNLVLTVILTVGVLDNFYDAIRATTTLLTKAAESKLPEGVKDAKLPEREKLPLGLGSGALTGSVVRGLSRLTSVDTERECECEAAALTVAYGLGLPCFAFRPNALEVSFLPLFCSFFDLFVRVVCVRAFCVFSVPPTY